VFHEDQAIADHVVKRLSELGYKSARPESDAELQDALRESCLALVIDSNACDQRFSKLCDWLEASHCDPALVILTRTASEPCLAVERFERRQVRACKLSMTDLKSERLAQCLAATASTASAVDGQQTHAVEGNVPSALDASRKLAIVQSMLQDIVGDDTLNSTMIISRIPSPDETDAQMGPADDITRLPSLVLQGQSLAALAVCHDAERKLDRRPVRSELKENVAELRQCLEREMLATEIELVTPESRLHPIARSSVLIGRPSLTRDVDVSINCRWFSRGERSLHLWSEDSEWFIEDLGSTNGCFVGGLRLEKNKRFALSAGQTTIEIGRSVDMRAPVVLSINHASQGLIVVSVSVGAGFDKSGSQSWPSLQEDLIRRWVIFSEGFVLGSGDASKLLGFAPQEETVAVSFRDGFWITPLQGTSLRLDDRMFRETVPLPLETDVEVGSATFRVVRARSSAAGQNHSANMDRAENG
jgi:hypothetical protein